MFIVFDGIDGCGKTTISKIVSKYIGYKWMKEPTDYFFTLDRSTPLYEASAFIDDRENHIHSIIDSIKLYGGVVMDRYYFSTFAYSHVKGVPTSWLNMYAIPDLIPDITFIIDIPVDIAQKRVQERGEYFDYDFMVKVRKEYLSFSKNPNVFVIDGTKDIKHVIKDVKHILFQYLTPMQKMRWYYKEKIVK